MMTNKDKIAFADRVLELLEGLNKETALSPKYIGYLNKELGFVGSKMAEIGTPVYEFNDRYIIYFELVDGKTILERKYLKETLSPAIDFI